MNENSKFKMLKKLLSKNEIAALEESLIITLNDGYELFGEYTIRKEDNVFVVNKYSTDLQKHFYSLKNAVVWICMYKRDNVATANRVAELDVLLESAIACVELHETLWNKSKDITAKVVYDAKIQESKMKKTIILTELSSYVNDTNRWQEKRFKEAVK